jgi:hypothetical protein
METENQYIPGVCNIGPAEIKRRRNGAIFSALFTAALVILLILINAGKIWRLTLFIPAASLGVSFLQWYFKFCVGFGIKGIFNFGDVGNTFSILEKENLEKDRLKAWRMILIGIGFGMIAAIVFYFS